MSMLFVFAMHFNHNLSLFRPLDDAIILGASVLCVEVWLGAFGSISMQEGRDISVALEPYSKSLNAMVDVL